MAALTQKTLESPFYNARKAAATHNDALNSREGAADIMYIDRGRLYRIENGISKPYPEEVHLMADLYNAPELRNYYCKEMCPLGGDYCRASKSDLDRITVKAMAALSKAEEIKAMFLDVAEDGEITEDEHEEMIKIAKELEKFEEISQNVKILLKRTLNREVNAE